MRITITDELLVKKNSQNLLHNHQNPLHYLHNIPVESNASSCDLDTFNKDSITSLNTYVHVILFSFESHVTELLRNSMIDLSGTRLHCRNTGVTIG